MKVVLHLTTACNLRCTYCYAPQKGRSSMKEETAREAIDLAIELGKTSACISYFGGEPLLRYELIKNLTQYAVERGREAGTQMHFRLSTNGTLLTEEILQFCRDHGLLFALSLDGDQKAHDAQRLFVDGKGSFDVIDEKLDMILEYNPHTVIASVITPATVDRLEPSIRYMWSRGLRFFAHQLDYTNPGWRPEHFAALEQSYRKLGEFYVEQARNRKHFHMTLFDEKLKSHASSPIQLGQFCDFGAKKISIGPDGRAFPCVQFVSDREDAAPFCIGDVKNGLTERREKLIAENKQERAQCEGCVFQGRCQNYCGCMNWQITGKLNEVPGILCAHERMLIPIADEVGNTLWNERNRTFFEKHYRDYEEIFPYSFD